MVRATHLHGWCICWQLEAFSANAEKGLLVSGRGDGSNSCGAARDQPTRQQFGCPLHPKPAHSLPPSMQPRPSPWQHTSPLSPWHSFFRTNINFLQIATHPETPNQLGANPRPIHLLTFEHGRVAGGGGIVCSLCGQQPLPPWHCPGASSLLFIYTPLSGAPLPLPPHRPKPLCCSPTRQAVVLSAQCKGRGRWLRGGGGRDGTSLPIWPTDEQFNHNLFSPTSQLERFQVE